MVTDNFIVSASDYLGQETLFVFNKYFDLTWLQTYI